MEFVILIILGAALFGFLACGLVAACFFLSGVGLAMYAIVRGAIDAAKNIKAKSTVKNIAAALALVAALAAPARAHSTWHGHVGIWFPPVVIYPPCPRPWPPPVYYSPPRPCGYWGWASDSFGRPVRAWFPCREYLGEGGE